MNGKGRRVPFLKTKKPCTSCTNVSLRGGLFFFQRGRRWKSITSTTTKANKKKNTQQQKDISKKKIRKKKKRSVNESTSVVVSCCARGSSIALATRRFGSAFIDSWSTRSFAIIVQEIRQSLRPWAKKRSRTDSLNRRCPKIVARGSGFKLAETTLSLRSHRETGFIIRGSGFIARDNGC